MTDRRCVICGTPLEAGAIRVRYEALVYFFDSERCKRIFQENPDRYLDAGGGVLPEPR
ncbi:MAG: YHS domain-containing protein [Chloroflexi bacterium]|nr:MAG: YHS domain-containing protein [Chloroflexota bacterium]